jgi:hypothetical protein
MILDWINPKSWNVIDAKRLKRDAGGKPLRTFPHPAFGRRRFDGAP